MKLITSKVLPTKKNVLRDVVVVIAIIVLLFVAATFIIFGMIGRF
jgi:hypothetical protein